MSYGASGSGKSTLLQCINGLELIQAGSIRVDGTQVNDPKPTSTSFDRHRYCLSAIQCISSSNSSKMLRWHPG
ncbi:ATP-binding cassette domain-containing protein [Mesorhizobium sp. M0619]|uniref:ATP-binding cassette domain-containing protein n=1 Tax=unclassified Mesorhizobium TaxID=325217 RepID=UPI0033391D39